MGLWYKVEPRTAAREHAWKFAQCIETPSERDDGLWLQALYFRNADRTQFGKVEVVGGPNLSGPDEDEPAFARSFPSSHSTFTSRV
jgi:hypothetical protein